jgi:hypothetical protein
MWLIMEGQAGKEAKPLAASGWLAAWSHDKRRYDKAKLHGVGVPLLSPEMCVAKKAAPHAHPSPLQGELSLQHSGGHGTHRFSA